MYFSMSTESHGEFGRWIKSVFYMVQRLTLGHFKWITLYIKLVAIANSHSYL